MSQNHDSSAGSWTFSELQRIDLLCDEFERAWSSESRLSIEQLLAKNTDLPRAALLDHLLRLELHLRQADEDLPTLNQYQDRFPADESVVIRAWRDFTTDGVRPEFAPTVTNRESYEASTELPENIGRFIIRRFLGRGAFGGVYLAHDPESGLDIALKVPHANVLVSERQMEELRQEAQTGSLLDHPNLVRTLGIEEVEGQLVIVQEFIDGQNLTEWFSATNPTPDQVVSLLIPVAQALDYLHLNHFVHRDLKPGNILVDSNDNAYIADFGLALHEAQQRNRDRRGELAGTRAYMAPEQVRRQIQLIDGQTDLWSFGVILYRLLTDRFPFGGPPPRNTADQSEYIRDLEYEIAEHDPRPPRQINPKVTRRLEQVCLRCLEKRKRDRYQTGQDLAEDLQLVLERSQNYIPEPSPEKKIRIVPKGLRSFDAADAPFFVELLPGPRTLDGVPVSLNFWKNRLSDDGGDGPIDVGVIYGPSGCGKSSFVKAGLIPVLGEKFVPLIIESTPEDTEVRLLKALRNALPNLPRDSSVVDACRWASERGAGSGRKVLLIFDQFEQWLHVHTNAVEHQLSTALRNCNGTRLQALLLVRDDFWMPLTRFMGQLEIPLQENKNTAAIDLFDSDHARKVLLGLGRAYGRLPNSDGELTAAHQQFLSAAIEGLAEDRRIICVRLALFVEMMKDRPWTPGELANVGGAKGIGVAFLEEKFGARAPAAYRPHRAEIRRILEALLPPYGSNLKGQMKTAAALEATAGSRSVSNFEQLLRILDNDLRLLTPVVPDSPYGTPATADNSAEPLHYQLTHDYLVPSVREWLNTELGRTRHGQALLRLRERSDDWNRQPETRRLPTWLEWLSILIRVRSRIWTSQQRRMMGVAFRRIATRMALVLAFIAIIISGLWEIRGRSKSKEILSNLAVAPTAQVPEIAEGIPDLQRWIAPMIRQTLQDEFTGDRTIEQLDAAGFTRWLNLQLAACQFDSDQLTSIVDHLPQVTPEELPVLQKLLDPQKQKLIKPLADRLAFAASHRSDTLRLAAMLAWADRNNPELTNNSHLMAEQLQDAAATDFPVWLKQLTGIAVVLRQPLLKLWRSEVQHDGTLTPAPEGRQRSQLLASLALYGRDDPEILLPALEQARSPEFATLLSPLKLLKPLSLNSVRIDSRFSGLGTALEKFQGQISASGAYVLQAQEADLVTLNESLSDVGYSPVSVRPYASGDKIFYTATWKPGGRETRVAFSKSKGEFAEKLAANSRENFKLVDIAFLSRNDADSEEQVIWCAVWHLADAIDAGIEVDFDRSMEDLPHREKEMQKTGYRIVRYVIRVDRQRRHSYTAIWERLAKSDDELRNSAQYAASIESSHESRYAAMYGDLRPGRLQTDVRVESVSTVRPDLVIPFEKYLQNSQSAETKGTDVADQLVACGRPADAVSFYDKALADAPDDFKLRIRLAKALAASGLADRLRAEISKLEDQLPQVAGSSNQNPAAATTDAADPVEMEIIILKFRLALLSSDIESAISELANFEGRFGPNARKVGDGLMRASATALLANSLSQTDPARAAEFSRRAIDYLGALAKTPPFPANLLVESSDWDSLRTMEEFQTLIRLRHVDRRYTVCWLTGTANRRSQQLLEQSAPQLQALARKLFERNYWPEVMSPIFVGGNSEVTFTSIWQAVLPSRVVQFHVASQRANRVLAMAHWGDERPLVSCLEDIEGERETPLLIIERLPVSGFPIDRVAQLLQEKCTPRLQRNLLLALGGYPADTIPAMTQADVKALAENATEAEVASAATWCIRNWSLSIEASQSPVNPSSNAANWYRNSKGHVMLRFDGKKKYLMGSPETEPGRESSEYQQWMRIGRPFSVSSNLVTALQYRQFLDDPDVKSRIPETHDVLAPRTELTERMWHLNCPQASLRRLDAMLYCEWLSEKEGVPEQQRCYPLIWDFAERYSKNMLTGDEQKFGYSPSKDILTRYGYRLPTEAEAEFAIRGDTSQSRSFGDCDELLDAYCWHGGNAEGRSWPVGTRKPNEFGLFDALGNVTQHCQDLYAPYRRAPNIAIRGDNLPDRTPEQEGVYVMRGSDFESPPRNVRSAKRLYTSNSNPRFTQGFRVARTEP